MAEPTIRIVEQTRVEVMQSLTQVPKTAHERIQRVLGEGGLVIQKDTISPAGFPVITGSLRASYMVDLKDNSVAVYSELDYAPAVEFGIRQRPQPFLIPALEKNYPRIEKAIHKAMEDL